MSDDSDRAARPGAAPGRRAARRSRARAASAGGGRPERFGDGLSEEVAGFTRLALRSDCERSRSVLHRLYEAGAGFAQLQLGLLAPAAKRLDGMWRNDEVTFIDVTLAAGNLQQMMRFVAIDLAVAGQAAALPRSILIAPAPGEAHVFGAAMAAEFFRRDGWARRATSRRPTAATI